MVDTKGIWFGRIWKREGRKVAPFENKYRVFYKVRDESGKFVLQSVETGEKFMLYPESLTDVYFSELFVNAYETYHLGYVFPEVRYPNQLSKEELLKLEDEYNAKLNENKHSRK